MPVWKLLGDLISFYLTLWCGTLLYGTVIPLAFPFAMGWAYPTFLQGAWKISLHLDKASTKATQEPMFQFGDVLGNSCSHTCRQPVAHPWVLLSQESTWVLKMTSGTQQWLHEGLSSSFLSSLHWSPKTGWKQQNKVRVFFSHSSHLWHSTFKDYGICRGCMCWGCLPEESECYSEEHHRRLSCLCRIVGA